jgi:polar amino acid transport system ATP-binding protein
MLHLENITKKFNEKPILDNVSLKIERGDIAVLLGPSGVGKSTLLRILNNLETIDSGNIYYNKKILDPKEISKNHIVGMVFQQFNLFEHLTVEQNITLVLEKVLNKNKNIAKKMGHDLLKKFGLEKKANKFISQLSGGQKQRLAIARALIVKPQIICLDEPTSSLDPLLTTYVAENIQQLADQGYIVLVATHDTDLLEKLHCTIYLMDKGKIVKSATSMEFFKNKDAYPRIKKFVSGKI